jgi:hypothetical protein
MISETGLLFIEPAQPPSAVPVIDRLTRMVCAAFRKAKRPTSLVYLGNHSCSCGAQSTNCDYLLPNGELTHSLCVHYAAHHRAEISPQQLAKIDALTFGEEDPNEEELFGPGLVLAEARALTQRRLEGLEGERARVWTSWGLDLGALTNGLQDGCLRLLKGGPDEELESFEGLAALLGAVKARRRNVFDIGIGQPVEDCPEVVLE